MDAYDISQKTKDLWFQHCSKSSGTLYRTYDKMRMCVWTVEGYREVVDVVYNENLKVLELRLDEE